MIHSRIWFPIFVFRFLYINSEKYSEPLLSFPTYKAGNICTASFFFTCHKISCVNLTGKFIGYKMLVSFFSTAFMWSIFSPDANIFNEICVQMHIGLHVQCQIPYPILIKIDVVWQIFIVFLSTKCKVNPFGSYPVVICLQMDRNFDQCSTKHEGSY